MNRSILDALLEAKDARRAVVLLTWLDGSRQELLDTLANGAAPADRSSALHEAATTALARGRASIIETDQASIFVQPILPSLRLLIVGAVHIGQHLAAMATQAGYAVTVIDPRSAFATHERFPGVDLSRDWPELAFARLGLDTATAVVTLTHDPKFDDPALIAALDSDAFYVGSLGSQRTHARRLERLKRQGVGESATDRILGPVGLDIGAQTPAEIAISILAEMTAQLRGKD